MDKFLLVLPECLHTTPCMNVRLGGPCALVPDPLPMTDQQWELYATVYAERYGRRPAREVAA